MKHLKTFENIDKIKDHFTKNLKYIDKLKDKLKNIHKLINDYFESNGCEVENYIDGGKWVSEYQLKGKNYYCYVSLYILDRKINIDIRTPIIWTEPLKYGYDFILDLFEKINEIKLIKKIQMRSDNDNDYHFGDNFQFKVNNPNKAIDKLTKEINLAKSVKKYNL